MGIRLLAHSLYDCSCSELDRRISREELRLFGVDSVLSEIVKQKSQEKKWIGPIVIFIDID
jgi:hypothetical protein